MSREIKFRAWHKEKHMFFVGDNFGTRHPLDCAVYAKQGQPVILMQFTGLLDKNGKEIFESDIVDVSGSVYSVIFENGCFQLFDKDSQHGRNPLCLERCKFITVIGSIHENPDLLK